MQGIFFNEVQIFIFEGLLKYNNVVGRLRFDKKRIA